MDATSLDQSHPSAMRGFDDLPGPKGIPFFGNAFQLEASRSHQQFEQWSREHGSIYKLKLMKRKVVVLGDHEHVAAMMRDRPDGFRRTTRLDEIWTEMGSMPFCVELDITGSDGLARRIRAKRRAPADCWANV